MKLHFSFQTLYQLTSGVLDHGFPRSVQEIGLPGELQAEGRNLLRSLLISHRQLLHTRRHHTSECTSSMPEFICSMVISTLHSFILHSTLFFFFFFFWTTMTSMPGYHDANQQESKNNIINLQDGRGVLDTGAHHFRNGGGR